MSSLLERMPSAGSEGARRASVDPAGGSAVVGVPDPEVSEKAKRRRFTAEYKLRILREADACKGDGDIGALLRREGLYSSLLTNWRRQRDELAKAGLSSNKRGRKAKAKAKAKAKDPRLKELERENARLQRRLARVETMLEIQKKASELLGIPLNPPDNDESSRGGVQGGKCVCDLMAFDACPLASSARQRRGGGAVPTTSQVRGHVWKRACDRPRRLLAPESG